jgi:hypothetical protein
MTMAWRAAMAGLEAMIALCAVVNAAYFVGRVTAAEPLSRKLAALVLAMLFLGSLAESVVLIAWLRTGESQLFSAAAWMFARSLTFVGTGFVSVLILRAMGNGK